MVAAINARLAVTSSDCIIVIDFDHIYWFKDGVEGLNPTGLRATEITLEEIEALYFRRRRHLINVALEQMKNDKADALLLKRSMRW